MGAHPVRDTRMLRYRRGRRAQGALLQVLSDVEMDVQKKRALHEAAPFLVADAEASAVVTYQIFTCFSPERTMVSPGLHW